MEIEFEVEPALATEPAEPVAGAPFEVRLAQDLIGPDRLLRLRDADRDAVIAERRLASGIARYRFELPATLEALTLELVADGDVVLRWPASGVEPVWPQAAATPATDRNGPQAVSPAPDVPCTDLPPEPDAGREALHAWLAACPLDNALLAGRDLRGADLAMRDLRRADLRGADLSDAVLTGATLTGATLLGARLDGADLSGADLEVADLGHASLFVTDLGGAQLRGADLSAALLTNTNLANADLTGARLTDAVLDAADFTGALCPDGYRTERRCDGHFLLP
jgi:hypothetical protein